MSAQEIIQEAITLGLDPVDYAQDLADGYGWCEAMTADAVGAVRHLLARARVYGR